MPEEIFGIIPEILTSRPTVWETVAPPSTLLGTTYFSVAQPNHFTTHAPHCRTSMTASPPHCLAIFTGCPPFGMLMAHETQTFKTSGGKARRRHGFWCPQRLRRRA